MLKEQFKEAPNNGEEFLTKEFVVEIKDYQSTQEGLKFSGYGSIYGNVDRHYDIMQKGAFSHLSKNYPLLFNHSQNKQIGAIKSLRENENGLFIEEGVIYEEAKNDASVSIAKLVRDGTLNKFSVGFTTKSSDWTERELDGRKRSVRVIKSAELFEISLVQIPANPLTSINLKSLQGLEAKDIRSLEKGLKDLGLESVEAKTLISICKNALSSEIEAKYQTTRDEELDKSYNQGKREVELKYIAKEMQELINTINNKYN